MPSRNWKMRVGDILECITRIQKYTHGYKFGEFEEDDKTIDSVLRNLEIIGEASRISQKMSKPVIPNCRGWR